MNFRPSLPRPHRPEIVGTRHVAAAGHYLAGQAAFQILEAGGNAVDAGVAGGLALGVVESEMVGVAGVAPILIYLAERDEILTISGVGTWPRAASCELFQQDHGGAIPRGILRTVVPAAPDAWITALERFGSMSFGDVAAAAIELARDGFPMYPLMAEVIAEEAESLLGWPSSAAIFLPGGRPPEVGKLFVQSDLGRTLQFLADEEAAQRPRGRSAGLQAARDAFYRGDIAAEIVRFQKQNGGLLTAEDLAAFHVDVEQPVRTAFGAIDVYGCGPWCQGPMLLQALNLLEGIDLPSLGHNTTAYVHTVTEAIKLAAADREACYGDPRFVDVPLATLLSRAYADCRRKLIRADRAWPEMPPAGACEGGQRRPARPGQAVEGDTLDTSYICVVDSDGNAFSATPSDGAMGAPVVPGTGLVPSPRGSQSWTDPSHPSCIAPGKRPRLTPNPALAIRDGRVLMPFGSPGGDGQTQSMLQVFLNIFVFEMEPQAAVEAPRFVTHSFPSSFEPHAYLPGSLGLEANFAADTCEALAALGHEVELLPDWRFGVHTPDIGAVCAIVADRDSGLIHGAADPRRPAYALGW